MNTKTYLSIVLPILFCFNNTQATISIKPLHTICCHLFGTENATPEIQDYFNKAADAFEIAPEKRFSIKNIHTCPFLNQFSSFTWFGTWIDKNDWANLSDSAKTWGSYHEMAHNNLHHPSKQIGTLCATLIASSVLSYYATAKPLYSGIATIISLAIIVPWYAHTCERDADIAAAQLLCTQNKHAIVQEQIDGLTHEAASNSGVWFNAPADQAYYLEKVVNNRHHEKK